MVDIHLNNGLIAKIDQNDLEKVSKYTWYSRWDKTIQNYYVVCRLPALIEGGKRREQTLHRFLLNPPTGFQIDHLNHDTLDNRRHNLRIANPSLNGLNKLKANSNNKSTGVLGVGKMGSGFIARIGINRKNVYLGLFKTIEEAKKAVEVARKKAIIDAKNNTQINYYDIKNKTEENMPINNSPDHIIKTFQIKMKKIDFEKITIAADKDNRTIALYLLNSTLKMIDLEKKREYNKNE